MDAKLLKVFRGLSKSVNVKQSSVDYKIYEDSQETYALYFDSGNTVRWEHYLDWSQKEPQSTGEFTVKNLDVVSISRALLDMLNINIDRNIKDLINKVKTAKIPLQDKKGNYLYNVDSEGKGWVSSKFPGQLRELWITHSGSPIDYFTVQPLLIEAFFNEGMLFHTTADWHTGRYSYESFQWNPTYTYKSLNNALMGVIGIMLDNAGDYTQRTNESFVVHTSFSQFIKNI